MSVERQIRHRLVEIAEELSGLGAEDFPEKHRLSREADALRRQLSETAEWGDETLRRWNERAAKGVQTDANDDIDAARARIVSPIEGGNGVG